MADLDLSIVVRARDLLSAELRRMGTTVQEVARQSQAAFASLGASTSALGQAVRVADAQVEQLGRADLAPLEAAITETTTRLEDMRQRAALHLDVDRRPIELLEQELEQARAEFDRLRQAGSQAGADVAARVREAEAAVELLGRGAVSLRPLETELALARGELEALRIKATEASGAISLIDKQRTDQLTKEVAEGEAAILRLRGTAEQTAGRVSGAFAGAGAAIKSALLPILPLLTITGAAFAAADSVKQSIEFQKALAGISAEANITGPALADLKEQALATTRALGLDDAKAAPALLAAITDGAVNAAEGLGIYNAAAKLAVVTTSDVAKSVDVLSSVTNAYRSSGLGAADAADTLFKVARDGKVNIDELAGGIDGVLPLASQLGVSFDELGAVIVSATQKGGGFAQGMQAVRSILGTLTDASPEARAALEGIDFSGSRIRAEGLVPVLADISERLGGNAEAIRRVFPEARSFGAVMAILGDEGRGLTRALAELESGADGLEDALGRRLQDPAVQLGIIFNRLRSEFAETFGGAFLRGVQQAVEEMGGLGAASSTVADIGRSLGASFGSSIPAIIIGAKDLALVFADIAKQVSEASDGFRAFATFGLGSVRLVTAGFREFLQILDLGIDSLRALDGISLFTNLGQEDLDEVNAAIAQIDDGLRRIAEGREGANGVELFNQQNIIDALTAVGDGIQIDIEAKLKAPNVRSELEEIQRQLGDKKIHLEAVVSGKTGFEELKRRLRDVFLEFGEDTIDIRASVDKAAAEIAAAFAQAPKASGEATQRTASDVRAALAEVEDQIVTSQFSLGVLQQAAQDAFASLKGDELATSMREFGLGVEAVDRSLGEAQGSAAALRKELAGLVSADITAVNAEIAKTEQELRAAAAQAKLLGLYGEDAATATAAITEGKEAKIRQLRTELERLNAQLADLSSTEAQPKRVTVPGIDLSAAFASAQRQARAFFSSLGDLADDVRLDRIKQALAALGDSRPIDELRAAFEQGIEPSEARQVALIEQQVQARRDVIDMLRETRTLTDAQLAPLEAATDQLAKQADLLTRSISLQRRALQRQAIDLGLDITLDENELRQQIAEAKERIEEETRTLERQTLAIELGVEVDDRAIADAQRAIDEAEQRLVRASVRREALHFGIPVEIEVDPTFVGPPAQVADAQLRLLIDEARDRAEDFADKLRARAVIREALTLGLKIDPRSIDSIEQQIAEARDQAEQFAAAHPIEAELVVSGIDGLSSAIGQIATDFENADEIAQRFFEGMIQRAIEALAQQRLVNQAIAAFGGIETGGGALVAQAFGVPAAGAELEAAGLAAGAALPPAAGEASAILVQGGFGAGQALIAAATSAAAILSTGSAVSSAASTAAATLPGAFARGGMPGSSIQYYELGGSPDLARAHATHVVPFAAGATPGLDRELSTHVLPYSAGGALDLSRTLDTNVTAWVAGGAPDIARAISTDVLPYALGGVPDAERALLTRVAPYADGAIPDLRRTLWTDIQPYATGGSPYIDTIGGTPALEHSRALAGAAIVPLSGGGVETPDGRHLPLTRAGGELAVRGYAEGAHLALFREAGPEAVMRTYRDAGGRPGLRAESGAVLPLTRTASGRLGVRAYAQGGEPGRDSAAVARTSGSQRHEVAFSISVRHEGSAQARDKDVDQRVNASLNSARVREFIEATVIDAIQARGGYRAQVRGDRA